MLIKDSGTLLQWIDSYLNVKELDSEIILSTLVEGRQQHVSFPGSKGFNGGRQARLIQKTIATFLANHQLGNPSVFIEELGGKFDALRAIKGHTDLSAVARLDTLIRELQGFSPTWQEGVRQNEIPLSPSLNTASLFKRHPSTAAQGLGEALLEEKRAVPPAFAFEAEIVSGMCGRTRILF